MNKKFEIGWWEVMPHYYFVKYNSTTDEAIAALLGISYEEYCKIMEEQFDGYLFGEDGLFFGSRRDVEKAIEWHEDALVASKLRGIV